MKDVAPDLVKATLAAEDVHFYEHQGVDTLATLRSAWIDVTDQGTTGASTITQQLVRNAVLDPREARQTTLRRKLREIVLAYQVDQRYSKDQILEMYLNRVYYGNQATASRPPRRATLASRAHDLNLAESALIAGLVQSPSTVRPDPPRRASAPPTVSRSTKERQRYVLEQMAGHNLITEDQARAAYDEKLKISRARSI